TLDSAAGETGALAIRSDIGDPAASEAAIAEAAEALGELDVVFINAGVGGFAEIPAISEEFWDSIHQVNLRGCFFAAQKALPHMRDGGAIVVTGSTGSVMAIPGNAAYAAAKAGLRAVVRTLAVELLPRKIRVNMVSPGPTETPIINRSQLPPEAIDALRRTMIANVPMRRMGEPEEIARAVLFLASDEASFITGADLFVDGGVIDLG
ncbi:MAG: SDR family oxidoreductase, partial [Sphingomonadaceae bacterium]|nr:SDR family oxidoreductase [Sphingomonadaceae bacterium]